MQRPLLESRLRSRRSRIVAGVPGLALTATPLALVASANPAHAADPVAINLVGINDFHGGSHPRA